MSPEEIRVKAKEIGDKCQGNIDTNYLRRVLHSEIELLVIEINNYVSSNHQKDVQELEIVKEELSKYSALLRLQFIKPTAISPVAVVIDRLDELIRFVGTWSFLIVTSIVIAVPCLLLSPLDYFLVQSGIIHPSHQINLYGKFFIANKMIQLSGIHLVVEGDRSVYGAQNIITCFSHASSMDAFIVTATVPGRTFSMGKSELFLIPFFSWCMLAFGGLPINRKNRDQAVKMLAVTAANSKQGDSIVIAPEGTRSKTGQLQEFKKGPFYLWEDLKWPIVPIVTFGAYELYPPGRQMTIPGKVYIRFLKAIHPHEASSREEMSLLVRRRMLEALRDGPIDAASPLTWPQRLECVLYLLVAYVIGYAIYARLPWAETRRMLGGVTSWQLAGLAVLLSVVVTMVFYVYLLYLKLPLMTLLGFPVPKVESASGSASPKRPAAKAAAAAAASNDVSSKSPKKER